MEYEIRISETCLEEIEEICEYIGKSEKMIEQIENIEKYSKNTFCILNFMANSADKIKI